MNEKEDETRAIDCPCGHRFEAEADEELFGLCREHVDRDHPEMERTDEQLRARIAADSYDPRRLLRSRNLAKERERGGEKWHES